MRGFPLRLARSHESKPGPSAGPVFVLGGEAWTVELLVAPRPQLRKSVRDIIILKTYKPNVSNYFDNQTSGRYHQMNQFVSQ